MKIFSKLQNALLRNSVILHMWLFILFHVLLFLGFFPGWKYIIYDFSYKWRNSLAIFNPFRGHFVHNIEFTSMSRLVIFDSG